ncbi:Bcmek1 [Botrytis cinerea B05.10]|uniref:Bcmek1 n=2 Tax=Botryotinia fuckeliana TaxID=40559 RepID=A0A384JCZ5_BOTFB|nr:Bcmek1 [Botrytis cinerea B05.10]ATZ48352.1 Bcmek1 [Botrytis cinerea B05.10]EMR84294.1 putative camk protein kinase protein [Botrytis cinerea BcDW1]
MEAPGLDCELGGQDYRENIDQSLMGTHEGNSHVLDSNIIASLSYEHAQTGQKLTIPILAKGYLHVGRETKCDFSIDSVLVSKQHFRIYTIIYDTEKLDEYPPSIYCEDLESRNGTYVNNTLIGIAGNERIGHLLVEGDSIEIRPDWKFQFHQPKSRMTSHMPLPDIEIKYFKDRYTISNHVLGSGIAGEVFLAKNASSSKQVACKVIKVSPSRRAHSSSDGSTGSSQQYDTDLARKSHLREVNILSKLNHPNIIRIERAFLSNERLYMFTELAAAGDLYTYFDSCDNKLEDAHARLITRQIALALEYLHSKGIAHRDVKMENILITNTDVGSRVILTDFGLANYTEKTTGRLFSSVGTEGYVAPEIIGPDITRGYTTAADMWSFGILTWSLLTGESSIPRGRLSQLEEIQAAKNFLSSDEKEVASKWSYLHRRVRSFLRGLLASDASQRMSAVQAVNHPWYKKPPVSDAIEQAYERVTKFWKPRDDDDILEYLPGYTVPTTEVTSSGRRKRLPDTSMSPYFNLDRHLQSRSPQVAKRRRILDDLKETGVAFVNSEPQQNDSRGIPRSKNNVQVKSVTGIDLFGSSTVSMNRQTGSSSRPGYETSSSKDNSSRLKVKQKVIEDSQSRLAFSSTASDAHSNTSNYVRVRKETNPANQEIHDTASQRVSKFCSAKAFKDEISIVRKERSMEA